MSAPNTECPHITQILRTWKIRITRNLYKLKLLEIPPVTESHWSERLQQMNRISRTTLVETALVETTLVETGIVGITLVAITLVGDTMEFHPHEHKTRMVPPQILADQLTRLFNQSHCFCIPFLPDLKVLYSFWCSYYGNDFQNGLVDREKSIS